MYFQKLQKIIIRKQLIVIDCIVDVNDKNDIWTFLPFFEEVRKDGPYLIF